MQHRLAPNNCFHLRMSLHIGSLTGIDINSIDNICRFHQKLDMYDLVYRPITNENWNIFKDRHIESMYT